MEPVREDRLLGGRVRLLQQESGHRAGTDAVLLAASCAPLADAVVADLGSGSGAVGLMIAARHAGCRLLLVERDPGLAELCRRNLTLNAVSDRAMVVVADLLASAADQRGAGLSGTSCDLVATNPPFLDCREARPSPDAGRARAHHMPAGGLRTWLRSAARILRPGGRLVMIHRADRLQGCLDAMVGFGEIRIRPVHARPEALAGRVLVSGIKGSRSAAGLLPALVLHDDEGRFTALAEALHRGEATLA